MKLNPTVKELMEDNKNLTVLGLYWAGTWRFTVAYVIICCLISGFITLLT